MNKKPFYITTTLPYVNAEPHIGFAMELVRADIVARYQALSGREVFFNTGTDEHGLKIYRRAKELSIEPQAYVDKLAERYKELASALGVSGPDQGVEFNFIRTTDKHHIEAAQAFWNKADGNGFIYKKHYQAKYCVGCELEKTDSELVDGRCPLHPLQEIELIDEENYFFKFSAFQERLLEHYSAHPDFIVPATRGNEIKAFVERGLKDFSISRPAAKVPWGIPVPGDPSQTMYVWFDALVDYISAIGWPDDEERFGRWWIETGGAVQYCGKDNIRQQSAMWQAMLMAAGLPPSKVIVIEGFVTGDGGIKMSKSLGNTVDPFELIGAYGTDALRYFVARELSPFEDSPFTQDRFKEAYNASLANGIGNVTSRILRLTSANTISADLPAKPDVYGDETVRAYKDSLEMFNIQKACDHIWARIAAMDGEIQATEPFKLLKSADSVEADRGRAVMAKLYRDLWFVAVLLEPIMPATAAAIQGLIKANKMPDAPLFARK